MVIKCFLFKVTTNIKFAPTSYYNKTIKNL